MKLYIYADFFLFLFPSYRLVMENLVFLKAPYKKAPYILIIVVNSFFQMTINNFKIIFT